MQKLFNIFILILFLTDIAVAQSVKDKKITIVARKKSMKEILTDISKQTNVYFSYNTAQIDDSKKITVIARNQPLSDVMTSICGELGLQYQIIEKQIILKPLQVKKQIPVVPKEQEVRKFTISGYVKDSLSKEVLIGAAIIVMGKNAGAMTNAYGFYSLTLPAGAYTLQISYIGYEKQIINVNLRGNNLQVPIYLKMREHELKVITINDENNNLLRANPLKRLKINSKTFGSRPFLGGDNDAVKSLQGIPGINLYGEGSVMFNVRGGTRGQNEVIIDEAPVFNPSHLLGFFSAIAPDAVNSMTVYKNSFPVRYGNRLSSLIDIRTKDGNMQKIGFGAKFSPLLSTFSIDGPIKKDKLAFFSTWRTSNLNYLFKREGLQIKFTDFHFKINYKPSRKNRYFWAFYKGSDNIQIENSAIRWQNRTMTLRWNHLFSDKIFSNTTLITSLYEYFLFYSIPRNIFWNSKIATASAKQDYSYFINNKTKIYFGFESKLQTYNPGNLNIGESYLRKVFASNVWANTIYYGGEYKANNQLSVSYGLRFTNWNNFGPTIAYTFDTENNPQDTLIFGKKIFNTYNRFSPRVSFLWLISKTASLNFAYDRNVQFVHYLSNSISPFTTIDFWMPSDMILKPQTADQYTVGIFKRFAQVEISAEIFYKKMRNQTDYANQPDLLLNPLFESQLRFGKIWSQGIEMSLNKRKGKFKYAVSYSFSRSYRRTIGVNNDMPYPAVWDKPHNLFINLSYDFSERVSLNSSFIYVSGNRFSSPTGFYYYMNYSVPIYDIKNNDKLPDYHRLDVSINWRLNKKSDNRFVHYLNFSIYNLYGHKNIIGVNFNKIQTPQGDFKIPQNYVTENEIIPSAMFIQLIFPSISYKFNFR